MMNDYIDYYNYMNNLNEMQNANLMPNNFQVPINTNQKKSNKTNKIAEPYIGFTRGNMFDNLYYEYKNYKPQELNPTNDKEYLQLLVQMYDFAAHDLGLYLDINPNDNEIIRKRAEYISMYKQALEQYENNYGPITESSKMLESTPWNWNTKKWPWEGNR